MEPGLILGREHGASNSGNRAGQCRLRRQTYWEIVPSFMRTVVRGLFTNVTDFSWSAYGQTVCRTGI